MAWSGTQSSHIFAQAMFNPILKTCWTTTVATSFGSLSADTINAAIFLGTNTPSPTVTLANSLYNADQWVSATFEASGSGYTAGGSALASKAFALDATATNSVNFTAANLVWTAVTLTAVFGCMVYDATTTGSYLKQGLCFNYFGGSQSITAGTFTILWATPASSTTTAVFNITV